MTDLRAGREELTSLALSAFRGLGIPIPEDAELLNAYRVKGYLSGNPDITPDMIAKEIERDAAPSELASNVVDLASPRGYSILNQRVQEIRWILEDFDPEHRYSNTVIGTLPGGGLDATSFKAADDKSCIVVIPDGFFHLTNLLTKIVILLQPITTTKQGPVFMPTASFEQLSRLRHPYVLFRQKDLVDSFFYWGDPRAALPYTQALPYQDRFTYLLVGTELFILAHELAHVLLGHLDQKEHEDVKALELEADRLALQIVTEYFRKTTNYPISRASICGFFFLSMVRMWEKGLETLTGVAEITVAHTHPVWQSRFNSYLEVLSRNLEQEEAPPWILHTQQAVAYCTQTMLPQALEQVSTAQPDRALSARVLPPSYQHLGQFNVTNEKRWWREIALLVGSKSEEEYRLGLWFLNSLHPMASQGLYRGIVDEDAEFRGLCERALIKIEPMYAGYIPRLRERYRETKEVSEFDEYILNLSSYLGVAAAAELAEARDLEPMDPRFFNSRQ